MAAVAPKQTWGPLIFNLENISYFIVVVGGFHSITPSLHVRHLKTEGELPYEKARNACWII